MLYGKSEVKARAGEKKWFGGREKGRGEGCEE